MMDDKLLSSSNIANTSKASNNNSTSSTSSSNTSSVTVIATATSSTLSTIPATNKMSIAPISAINPSSGKTAENGTSVPDQPQPQQQHVAMKCPRCDSSNTKFCYYNNYSLSQPRHFCKACKRYWTRGGTLRNVPVGGGCRKNKRVKKPTVSVSSNSASASASSAIRSDHMNNFHTLLPSSHLQIPTSSHLDASMLFALQNSSADMSLALPSLHIPNCPSTAFDLQPQLSSLGLSFSGHRDDDFLQLNQLPQLPNTSSSLPMHLLSDYSLFGSSFASTTAALLASTMKPQSKKIDEYQPLFPYDQELQAFNSGSVGSFKQVKLEAQNENAFNNPSSCADEWEFPQQNSTATNFGTTPAAPIVTPNESSSYLYWNSGVVNGGWSDTTTANCGSSVAHLI